MEPLFIPEEIGQVLRLSLPDVVALIEAGELGALKLPTGELRVRRSDLRAFVRGRHLDFARTPAPSPSPNEGEA
jgi:excisionase family DNA binding protein